MPKVSDNRGPSHPGYFPDRLGLLIYAIRGGAITNDSEHAVIPAKAGIHLAFKATKKMDSGFRRNDDRT